jgi:hypothetical protein
MIVTGVAAAYAAIFFAYLIAAEVQAASVSALRFVIDDASVWVAGPGSARVDGETGTLVQDAPLPP